MASRTLERTLAQQLSGAFKLFGALVTVAFVVTAVAYALSWSWLTPELEESRRTLMNEGAAHAAMLDEETALRGFLLTREVRFLEPYTRGEVALASANRALGTSVDRIPELGSTMFAVRLAEEGWRERWAKIAANTRPSAIVASMSDDEVLFDAYRSAEVAFADALNRYSDALSRRVHRAAAARVTLELGVFVAILLLAVRQHLTLHSAIVVPVAALLRHIRRIRDGQLEPTTERGGPQELAELATGLNEMVRALATAQESAATRDDKVREHSVQLRQILDASREFSESLNLAYVVGAVRKSTATVGGYERVIVWLIDDARKGLVATGESAASVSPDDLVEMGEGLAGRSAKSGRMAFEGADGQVRFSESNVGPVRAIAVPLIVGARVIGALEARYAESKATTTELIEILETLASHAATALESARCHEVIEERSQMDALTRLFNRRRLTEDLDAECKRCLRYGRPLAFVMLDIDHFKAFNDTHGHPQGDTALQQVAEIISACVRATDTAYRYGGEEFCILLRETSPEGAGLFAERVRQRIEHRFTSGPMAGITASFGGAAFLADRPTPRELVEAADVALYEAKHAGRNRTVLSSLAPCATDQSNQLAAGVSRPS